MNQTESIRIEGIVQGVGFRPTVSRLAQDCGLTGWVRNDGEGVLIQVFGDVDTRNRFLQRLSAELPPLARIDRIWRELPADDDEPPRDFRILASEAGEIRTGVVADAATCPACLAEVLDAHDRRHGYPFANCTHCGPRLSIVRAIPYDRVNTSMASFPLCPECLREYQDSADRRFHAQPIACPACGPRLWLEESDGALRNVPDPIAETAEMIRQGCIVAIKGLGGFHLACDAEDADAVARLRQRKQRYGKAFALMARDVEMVRRHAEIGELEMAALQGSSAPIVLLEQPAVGWPSFICPTKSDRQTEWLGNGALMPNLPIDIAPGQYRIGFMLPYTPLHHLLMQQLNAPIVLTSGNRSDEPQCIDNAEARLRLEGIVHAFLMHDRDIVNRLDDSVLHIADGKPRVLRRGRGYAPASLVLPAGFENSPEVLAMGAELKNSFCLIKNGKAIVSQHMGDLEDAVTRRDYRHNLDLYRNLYRHQPELIVVDLHPDYVSTQIGQGMADEAGIPCHTVQHHHAHVAACLAEHDWPLENGSVLGIALDGLGLGDDGELWGGEFLLADYRNSRRIGQFPPVAMPGGNRCMKEPWRNAYAHLDATLGWENVACKYGHLPAIAHLQTKPLESLGRMIRQRINSPQASSCGRLFDAAAALLGICADEARYEGQAACELEALAARGGEHRRLGKLHLPNETGSVGQRCAFAQPTQMAESLTLDWAPLWQSILEDLAGGIDTAEIAARFHAGVAGAVAAMAIRLCEREGLKTAVLSGGSFQNRLLLEGVAERLRGAGIKVMAPERYPANDGGIALGQAVIATARWMNR